MKESYFPKALLFKEWRDFGWYMTLAVAIIAGRALLPVLITTGSTQGAFRNHALLWNVLMPNIYGITLQGANASTVTWSVHGLPATSVLDCFIATVLGIVLWSVDRNRGTLMYGLTGPLRRQALLRVKFTMGTTALLAANVIAAGSYLWADYTAHLPVALTELTIWFALNFIVQMTVFATAMTMAIACGSGVVAAMCTFVAGLYPAFIGRLVTGMQVQSGVATPVPSDTQTVRARVGQMISEFSPLHYFGGRQTTTNTGSWGNQPAHFDFQTVVPHSTLWPLFLLLWIVAWYTVALVLLKVAEAEYFDRFFVVSAIWPWAITASSGLVAYEVAYLTTRGSYSTPGDGFLIRFALAACVLCAGFTMLHRTYRRLRRPL